MPFTKKFKIVLTLTCIFLCCVFILLSSLVATNSTKTEDVFITQQVQSISNSPLTLVMKGISFFGYPIPAIASIAIVCLLLLLTKNYEEAFCASWVLPFDIVTSYIKTLIDRPRPGADIAIIQTIMKDYSFPSNHVVHYVLLFGLICYFAHTNRLHVSFIVRKVIYFLPAFLVATVGISRIYLGAHWFTDILAAYCLGCAFLSILLLLYNFLEYKNNST